MDELGFLESKPGGKPMRQYKTDPIERPKRPKNPMGKSRKPGNAYIVTEDPRMPGWRWEVLKTWQVDGTKPYARAFCYVMSPFTGGSGDMGDTYVTEIGHTIVDWDHDVFPTMTDAARALFGAGVAFGVPV